MEHPVMTAAVPARTELAGNHTDHQGGRVLAAGIGFRLYAQAAAAPMVTVESEGFGSFRFDPAELSPARSRPGSAEALCRGVLEYLKNAGYPVGGFHARLRSEIPAGAGLSSSAAFGVLMGRLVSGLYGGAIPPITLAKAAQYGENVHFGKPCGLMDQCACALGGVQQIDFIGETPLVEAIKTDFFAPDHTLLLIDTGSAHADLTADYAAIPQEMRAVAACFGASRLRDVEEAAFTAELPMLRSRCGDRAVLRALHFFAENARVPEMAQALRDGDCSRYLALMDDSGRSSAENLQNSSVSHDPQPIPLALALCRRVLGHSGAARVHGGGFAGMIQALAPADSLPLLRAALEPLFGVGCVKTVEIAQE